MAPESNLCRVVSVNLQMGRPSTGRDSFKEFQSVTWINSHIARHDTTFTCRARG
jgi:hypothetical protein